MIDFINAVGESIPNTLKIGEQREVIKDNYTLRFFGFYEYTGFSNFFKKVWQGVKARNTWAK